jgi:mycofactocin system glycosyltransferase
VTDTVRFLLDPDTARRGRDVLGGSPTVLVRLTAAGVRVYDAIARGDTVRRSRLTDRLLHLGMVHPDPASLTAPFAVSDVTVVTPVHNDRLRPDGLVGVAAVVIVDDASTPPIPGATIRLDDNVGPGPARMVGLASVTTPLVAFVDADVRLRDGWLEGLLAHFADEHVAAVAPRVISTPGTSTRAVYESMHSPLDLGDRPARVRPGSRVSYVPSAAIVMRTDVLRSIGGFDPALRYGEDVDVIWRFDEAGYTVRYEPSVIVEHEPRPTWTAWWRQRASYGSAAAPLYRRHPSSLAPLRLSAWTALGWTAGAVGETEVSGLVMVVTAWLLQRKLRTVPQRDVVDLIVRGHLGAGRPIATAIRRAWWPLLVLLALRSRAARRALVLANLAPLLDWRGNHRRLGPMRYTALRVLDDVAYSSGVWRSMIRERTAGPLQPDLPT